MKNKQLTPILACAAAFSIWGLNMPFIKICLESIPSITLLFIKFTFGAVVTYFFARKKWKPFKSYVRRRIIIATIVGYSVSALLLYEGIRLAGGLNASLLYLTAPLILYYLSIRYLRERYDAKLLLAVVSGFLGALLIIGAPLLDANMMSSDVFRGSLLIVGAILSDVAGTILIKPVLNKVSVMQMMSFRFIVATFTLLPFIIVGGFRIGPIDWTASFIIALTFNLVVATLVAFYLYHWGLKRISGEQISSLHYFDPLFGAVGSIIILGENLTATMLAGVLLIVYGIYQGEFKPGSIRMAKHISHHR